MSRLAEKANACKTQWTCKIHWTHTNTAIQSLFYGTYTHINTAIQSLFSHAHTHTPSDKIVVFYHDWKLLATQRSNRCFLAHTYSHGHDIFLRWRDIFRWRSGFVVVGDMLGDNLSVGEAAIVLVGEALFWWWKRVNSLTKHWTNFVRILGQWSSVFVNFADEKII